MRSPVTNEPPAYRSLFTNPTIRLLARAVKGVARACISGKYQQHGPRWASGPTERTSHLGTLFYGASRLPIRIDDRILAHVKAVVTAKMRRGEGFLISWTDSGEVGHGRSSGWVHPNCDLHYKFDGGTPPKLE